MSIVWSCGPSFQSKILATSLPALTYSLISNSNVKNKNEIILANQIAPYGSLLLLQLV